MHLVDILEISCAPPYYDDQKKMTYVVYQISLGDQCPVYSVTLEVYLLGRHLFGRHLFGRHLFGVDTFFGRHLFELFTGEMSFRIETMHSFHSSHLESYVFVCRKKFTRIIKLTIIFY